MTALSKDIARLTSKARSSLVQVYGGRRSPSSGTSWDGDGLIVTAAHTLESDDHLEVLTEHDDRMEAELVGRDPRTDVALLRAKVEIPAPEWADTSRIEPGELALIVAPTRTGLATICALDGEWTAPSGGRLDRYIETDPKRFRGFSGSLLVSGEGETLGMNTTGLSRRTSLAIPTETLRRVVDHLLKHGEVRRGYLGITTSPVRLPDTVTSQRVGLLVLSVQKNSPAADAGLYLGDVLLAIEDRILESPMGLLAYLTDETIDHELQARVLRAGEEIAVSLKVGARHRS